MATSQSAERAGVAPSLAAHILCIAAAVGLLLGCSSDRAWQAGFGERIVRADSEAQNWLSYGRNYQETRYSPLDQINRENVRDLRLAWFYDLDSNKGQEATPIVVDGVIFTSTAWSRVKAFDGVTGRLLWEYDPEVPGAGAAKSCCDLVSRGVAYWEGKVILATLDGRLIALDAKTGKPVWSTATTDPKQNYVITGAPRVAKGLVFIGNSGADLGVRGYVSAYDVHTGKLRWRFYTVPNPDRRPDGAASDDILRTASDSWGPGAPHGGGGGTVWDSIVYDPELDQLYVGTGNGSGWARTIRSPKSAGNNDNLFLSSILALDPDTGKYLWHYQQVPGDEWDYTATQPMMLATLRIAGADRKVLMQAPKNGFFYVLDRATGKLISADVYGEQNWARSIDPVTGRPDIDPEARYSLTRRPWRGKPAPKGNHSWQPMAYSPETGLVYIPIHINAFTYKLAENYREMPKGVNLSVDFAAPAGPPPQKAQPTPKSGFLIAWDPVAKREVWRKSYGGNYNGGLLTTGGGLLFQGDMDGFLHAYDVRNGDRLWSFNAQTAILAPPVTWSKAGVQYVTVVVGWGAGASLGGGPASWDEHGPRVNRSRVLTFALGGKAELPPAERTPMGDPPEVAQFADAATVEAGRLAYHRTCFACHGSGAIGGGVTPDLRYSGAIGDRDTFADVVLKGVLVSSGMDSFAANFSPREVEAIRAYLVDRAIATRAGRAQFGEGLH